MSSSDVSAVVNFFPNAAEGFSTSTSGSVSSGATTVGLTATTGLTSGNVFIGIIEPGLSKEQTFTGTVDTSGSQITGVKWTRGSNADHAAGVTVVDYVTGTAINMISKGIQVAHNSTGTHKSGATYASPIFSGSATGTYTLAGTPTITSPTITTPTIADFSNATHAHTSSATGGSLGSNAITTAMITNANVTADKLGTGAANAIVATSETTASTSYADLSTSGPSVTVTIGANGLALVSIYANFVNDTANARSVMGYAVSGATTIASTDTKAVWVPQQSGGGFPIQCGITVLLTGLTAGSTTFKAQYRVTSGTGTFLNRTISVVPL